MVNLLIVLGANIRIMPQIAHIADDQRSDASLVERRYQVRRLLVFQVSNLLSDLLELPLLGADDSLAPLRPLLHASINAGVEHRLELVPVLDFGAQEPPVQKMGLFPVV